MINRDENSATAREFLAYRGHQSNTLYSMGNNHFYIEDALLETFDVIGSNKEDYLQHQTELINE